jgi:uncharacterized membrane protein YhaH (DUF805 family)
LTGAVRALTHCGMTRLIDEIHPYGWTDRRTYRLALLGCTVLLVVVKLLQDEGGWAFFLLLPLAMATWLVLLSLTIRRLRDAGWSVWWALVLGIGFRPPLPDLQLAQVSVPLDALIGMLVQLTPIGIGLLAKSLPETARVA